MCRYFCPENASDYLSNECPAGYYCPPGTSGPNDNACPAGTWSNETKLQDIRGCKPCPEGKVLLNVSVVNESTERFQINKLKYGVEVKVIGRNKLALSGFQLFDL